jgi:hypothetical protein
MDWRKHFVGQARYASINWEVTGFCSCGSGTIPDVSGRFLIYGFRFGLIIVMSLIQKGFQIGSSAKLGLMLRRTQISGVAILAIRSSTWLFLTEGANNEQGNRPG